MSNAMGALFAPFPDERKPGQDNAALRALLQEIEASRTQPQRTVAEAMMGTLDKVGAAARSAREYTNPWRHMTPSTVAGFLPGAGIVQGYDDFGRGRDALKAGRYKDAALDYGAGVLNAATDMVPMLAALPPVVRKGAAVADDVPGIKAYHGSPHDFDAFDVAEARNGYHWFSNNKGYAEGLAGRKNHTTRDAGVVYEANLNLKNPLKIDVSKEAAKLADDLGIDPSDRLALERAFLGDRNFEFLVDDYVDTMKAGGHDAIVFQNTLDGYRVPTDQYVVFDDSLIEILRKYGVASVAALPPAVLLGLGLTTEQAQALDAQNTSQDR